MYASAAAEIEQYVREYRTRFGEHFSSDKAAELFPEYSASAATRTANRAAVTKSSHFVADRAFLDRLREQDDAPVTFVIGGPGAGKTTSSTGALAVGNIVFDGSAVHAEPLIHEAAALGRKVNVQYVHRDPVDAFRGTLDRAMNSPAERGRVIPLRLHDELHRGSADAIKRIAAKYAVHPAGRDQHPREQLDRGAARRIDGGYRENALQWTQRAASECPRQRTHRGPHLTNSLRPCPRRTRSCCDTPNAPSGRCSKFSTKNA